MGTECRECAHYPVCAKSGKKCNAYMSAGVVSGALENMCLYNEGIECANHDRCEGCGWSPAEHQRRVNELHWQAARGEKLHVSVQKRHPLEL